ncbi:hypothetical protein MMC18_001328 [Xylographa bjoerkii]|nr:hypothetical protein [Xylographa bjoerkii]
MTDEMEGVRFTDPEFRAEYNAELALLALFRIDLALKSFEPISHRAYDGCWVPKQLKHIADKNNIYEPIDLVAYTGYVVNRAVNFIQFEECYHLQHTNMITQRRVGVANPSLPPFTPIFMGPVHEATKLYELVRQVRHPDRKISLHRIYESAEQRIYELFRWRTEHYGQRCHDIGSYTQSMSFLWVDGNHIDVAMLWEMMASFYKVT